VLDKIFVYLGSIRSLIFINEDLIIFLLFRMQRSFHLSTSFFDREVHELFLLDQPKHKRQGEILYHNLFYEFPCKEFYLLQGKYSSYKAFVLTIRGELQR
jgi:hypothetical protein